MLMCNIKCEFSINKYQWKTKVSIKVHVKNKTFLSEIFTNKLYEQVQRTAEKSSCIK